MIPATIAGKIPCSLITPAIFTITVSASPDVVNVGIMPTFETLSETIPIKVATNNEITTQIVATLRDIVNFFASLIAIKRRRICGIPKYPRPQAKVETIGINP